MEKEMYDNLDIESQKIADENQRPKEGFKPNGIRVKEALEQVSKAPLPLNEYLSVFNEALEKIGQEPAHVFHEGSDYVIDADTQCVHGRLQI